MSYVTYEVHRTVWGKLINKATWLSWAFLWLAAYKIPPFRYLANHGLYIIQDSKRKYMRII